jgi:hypothetical protein
MIHTVTGWSVITQLLAPGWIKSIQVPRRYRVCACLNSRTPTVFERYCSSILALPGDYACAKQPLWQVQFADPTVTPRLHGERQLIHALNGSTAGQGFPGGKTPVKQGTPGGYLRIRVLICVPVIVNPACTVHGPLSGSHNTLSCYF